MYLETYPYEIYDDMLAYEFKSVGPKGPVCKIVQFTPTGVHTYNLAFGDLDEPSGDIDDIIITNNNDTKKVLSTVASIVQNFIAKFPKARIVGKGSTHSRTRLYRMGINNNLDMISTELVVYGYMDGKWEFFERAKDYDAFLVHRK